MMNVGIIGVGIVGERFLKAFQRQGQANIVGILVGVEYLIALIGLIVSIVGLGKQNDER